MAKTTKVAGANETNAATNESKNVFDKAIEKADNAIAKSSQFDNSVTAALDALDKTDTSELIELTSELLKLETGESFTGVMTNQFEMVESQEAGKEPFEAVVLYAKNQSKVLCADAVALSVAKRMFAGVEGLGMKAVKIVNQGMRKSTSGGGKEYRDLKIYTL